LLFLRRRQGLLGDQVAGYAALAVHRRPLSKRTPCASRHLLLLQSTEAELLLGKGRPLAGLDSCEVLLGARLPLGRDCIRF
jgi:hypothetical protein